MPSYNFRCSACQEGFEVVLPFSQAKDPQTHTCGAQAVRVLGAVSFVMKGHEWAGKNAMIKGQMAEKNKVLDGKQAEYKRHAQTTMRVKPNVDGEQVDTWAEAKQLAASKGKDASSYDALIKEQATRT